MKSSAAPAGIRKQNAAKAEFSGILNLMGKEIDRVRATSALEVIRQHPGLTLFALSPLIGVVAVTWILAGAGWGIALALVLLVAGGAFVVVKR